MRFAVLFCSALGLGLLATEPAKACNYVQSSVIVQPAAVSYGGVSSCGQVAAVGYAAPSAVVVQPSAVVVRSAGYGGYSGFQSAGFAQPSRVVVNVRGGGGGGARFAGRGAGGGGGGGIGGLLNGVGRIANSPAGIFALGALAAGGF